MSYTPRYLKLWKHPECYFGATWEEYYVVLRQHRDSDRVTRSNFRVALTQLRAIECQYPNWDNPTDHDTAMLVNPYESHWAVGHVEWIGVHKDSPEELLRAADTLARRLEEYPILDEMDCSELEYSEVNEYWDSLSVSTRLSDYIQPANLPCFAARHDLSTILNDYCADSADSLWESLAREF